MASMTRRALREHLLKLLYLREFHDKDEFDEQFGLYIGNFTNIEESNELRERFDLIVSKLDEIDKMIESAAVGWKFNRIGKIELMILRIALYEIKFDDSVPDKAAVNEAVELSKIYGSDDSSYGFVNGVLGRFLNDPEK
ncbi:MAG: transcription antitermination factor NusB [Lachnospiraceae bacterium]|nr:transcription antitermination factor NusB [Lachnospiraceae bacterium]